ncbi:MAG TPA: ankyrin repeat domain-containing protein [bacterium]|nr:ankyrin repeat domain-containing protein [bacterium]
MSTARVASLVAVAAAGTVIAGLLLFASPPRTLHEAAAWGTATEVRAFLDAGAKLESLDAHGDTPLRVAARAGNEKTFRELLEHCASVDSADPHGETALHLAAEIGNARMVELLLQVHANWTLLDDAGRSALDFALASGDVDTVRALRGAARPRAPRPGAPPVERGSGRLFASEEIPWRREADGTETCELWGHRLEGEHEALRRLPPGFAQPLHSHASLLRDVLLSGNLEAESAGTRRSLLPGSALFAPLFAPYSLTCMGPDPCVLVEDQLGPADQGPAHDRRADGAPTAQILLAPGTPAPDAARRGASAVLWTDEDSGEKGLWVLYPAGFTDRAHRHGAGEDVFLIRGELDLNAEGIPGIVRPGGFERLPAGTMHTPHCVSREPCFFYVATWGALTTTYADGRGPDALTAFRASEPVRAPSGPPPP